MRISDWSSDVCSSDLPVARLQEQDRAPAKRFEAVRILDARADIVDPAIFVAVIAGDAQADLVLHDRQVDHRIIALAHRARPGEAEVDARRGFEIVEVGTLGVVTHRPGERGRPKQGGPLPGPEMD